MKLAGILNVKGKKSFKLGRFKLSRKKLKKYLLYGGGAFILFVLLLFAWYAKDLPTPAKLSKMRAAESTKILDRNGGLLYETGEERRTIVKNDEIAQVIKDATISAEDDNFYNHHGLDFKGIARAAIADIFSGSRGQGGSTITQQYVKNAVLTKEKTYSRKIKEVILSIELEQLYSKDEILNMYLNEIPYGGNTYGIEEASKQFFNKSANDLTLSEAATLAAIPQAPTYFSPYGSHTDKLFARKDYVLSRMVELGYVSEEDAERAKNEAPTTDDQNFQERKDSIKAPHFVMYVKEKLVDLYGERVVDSGGLKVTTSLDYDLQQKAEEAIDKNENKLERYGATNAAIVSVDSKTGEIVSMVGGRDFFDAENGGNVNVTDSLRQPGSSFKPIVYATAFKQKRFFPAFTLFDLRTDFSGYSPQNYDGSQRGPVSMRFALANSLNIPAVKTLALVGVPEALKTARDMGITSLDDPDRYGLALVLGGGEVKPIEMAGAFGAFSDKGTYHQPTSILKVENYKGKTLYEYKAETNKFQAIDPQIAYEITDILDDDGIRRATFGYNNPLDFGEYHVAAKTGTTQNFHDAWTVGYSPKYATAVWVGNNDNAKMNSGAAGAVVAAPIFHDYMVNVVDNTEFEKPSEIKEEVVEKFSGKLPSEYSKETLRDIFASWQVPTKRDDINVIIKINKVNGKKATDSTPSELVEERLFTEIHNEWGDKWKNYSSWEGPIRAWAEQNGVNLLAPEENDDSYSQRPSIQISSPANRATVNGTITLTCSTSSEHGVSEVGYYLEDNKVASSNSSPYSASLNTTNYSNGSHTLKAKITDSNGVSETSSATITISNEAAPTISGLSISPSTNSATLSFSTNITANSAIRYGSSPSTLNHSKTSGSSTKSHSALIPSLNPSTKYYYEIKATNSQGRSSTSSGSFTTSS